MNVDMDQRLHDALEHLAKTRDAFSSLIDGLMEGVTPKGRETVDSAAALAENALEALVKRGRSTRRLLTSHPVESVVLIGVLGVAVGWLMKRMWEPKPTTLPSTESPSPSPRSPRRTSRNTPPPETE